MGDIPHWRRELFFVVASLVDWDAASIVVVQGLIALWHEGSSWARDRTLVPYIARRILNHWTTREIPAFFFSF